MKVEVVQSFTHITRRLRHHWQRCTSNFCIGSSSGLCGAFCERNLRCEFFLLLLKGQQKFNKSLLQNAPKKCFPYVALHGTTVLLILFCGLILLNAALIIIAVFKAYFFVVIYSVYKSMSYEGGQVAYEAHNNASGAGYEQFYEPEGYNANADGYQTTQFQGP